METRAKNQKEQQKATIFVQSFAPIPNLRKVVDIKSNEKPVRATTGTEEHRKTGKSNDEQLFSNNGHRRKNKMGNKKRKRATKGTKNPNGNQA